MPKEDLEFIFDSSFEEKKVFDNPYYLIVKNCLEFYGDEATLFRHWQGKNNFPNVLLGKEKNFISSSVYEAAGLKIYGQIYSFEDKYKLIMSGHSNCSFRELKAFMGDFKRKFKLEQKNNFGI